MPQLDTSTLLLVGLPLLLVVRHLLGRRRAVPAKAAMAAGARRVDVRTPSEFHAGHLAGAINLPLSDLPARLRELGDRSQPLVVYCRSGGRSGQARHVLESAGFTAVFDLGAMSNG